MKAKHRIILTVVGCLLLSVPAMAQTGSTTSENSQVRAQNGKSQNAKGQNQNKKQLKDGTCTGDQAKQGQPGAQGNGRKMGPGDGTGTPQPKKDGTGYGSANKKGNQNSTGNSTGGRRGGSRGGRGRN